MFIMQALLNFCFYGAVDQGGLWLLYAAGTAGSGPERMAM
jgi:hypothetical protein